MLPTSNRVGAPLLLVSIHRLYPWLRHVCADAGYAEDKLEKALARRGNWTIHLVNGPWPLTDSSCSCADGLSSAPSPGSFAADASPLAWIYVAHIWRLTRTLATLAPKSAKFQVSVLGAAWTTQFVNSKIFSVKLFGCPIKICRCSGSLDGLK